MSQVLHRDGANPLWGVAASPTTADSQLYSRKPSTVISLHSASQGEKKLMQPTQGAGSSAPLATFQCQGRKVTVGCHSTVPGHAPVAADARGNPGRCRTAAPPSAAQPAAATTKQQVTPCCSSELCDRRLQNTHISSHINAAQHQERLVCCASPPPQHHRCSPTSSVPHADAHKPLTAEESKLTA